jgi:Integrase zinc binding domain
MDSEKLHADILAHLASDPMAQKHLGDTSDPRWTQTNDSFLRYDGRIYVPESENLRLRVLQYKHDHVLSGHFSQNKTLALIRREYTWPGLRSFVIEFCKSCMTCMRSKSQRHRPYPNSRGIQYLWISFSSYRDLRDSLLYWW